MAERKQPEWIKPKGSERAKLKLYNSLTRSNTEFIPMNDNRVTWYSCGPTVYDASHMGHARNYVTIDITRRLLEDYFGYNVMFVQNVTDIDDKIIVRGRQGYLFDKFKKSLLAANQGGSGDTPKGELVSTVTNAAIDYAKGTLPNFPDTLEQLFEWEAKLDAQAEAEKDPKFNMHLSAVKSAQHAIVDASSLSIENFLDLSKTVLLYHLDKQQGATVTDPKIFRELAAYWEADFDKDMGALNVRRPTVTTRVSEYVPEIVQFVQKIIDNGFAYQTEDDGSVYFDTTAFEAGGKHFYAKLQPWNRGQQDLIDEGEGSLSAKRSGKKSRNDFALWKASKPGEPFWDSPWGQGRPGWHIECSVMASEVIGSPIDIHTGGIDLAFPHHDNELAQSEAAHGCEQWVNYFLHTGHLHIEGQKMSKSLKNFITIKDALERYSSRQLRLAFAMQQWNSPMDFKSSLSEVKAFESTMSNFFNNVRALDREEASLIAEGSHVSKKVSAAEMHLYDGLYEAQRAVHSAFCDNLAVPQALTVLGELVQKANSYIASKRSDLRLEVLRAVAQYVTYIFGILGFPVNADGIGWTAGQGTEAGSASKEQVAAPYVSVLSKFRDEVRTKAIDKAPYSEFLDATDRIRNFDLLELGVSLDDRGNGQAALVKFLEAGEQKELITQRDEKARREEEKKQKKQEAARLEAEREKERQEKAKIPPKELFKTDEYSAWDEEGLPTHDKAGEPISKSMKKKLTKQLEAHKKLHATYSS